MFESRKIIDEVTKFLIGIQPNVDWNEFFNKHIGKTNEQILSRIRALLWVDKNLDYENELLNTRFFEYYTKLLFKTPDIEDYDICIMKLNDKSTLDNYFNKIIAHKIDVLTKLLSLRGLKYRLVEPTEKCSGIMFPTGSLSYDETTLHQNNFIGIMLDDGFHNIYIDDNEKKINNIKLLITSLIKTQLTIQEILQQNFGLLNLKYFIPS